MPIHTVHAGNIQNFKDEKKGDQNDAINGVDSLISGDLIGIEPSTIIKTRIFLRAKKYQLHSEDELLGSGLYFILLKFLNIFNYQKEKNNTGHRQLTNKKL
jgi:hypothetical protein